MSDLLNDVWVCADRDELEEAYPETEYFIKSREVGSNLTLWFSCPGRKHTRAALASLISKSRDKSLYFGGANLIFHELAVYNAEMNQEARIAPMGQVEGSGQFVAVLKKLKESVSKKKIGGYKND